MKSFICVMVLCAGLFCGNVQAQECFGGVCQTPVRSAVAAVAKPVVNVTREVAQVPMAVVQNATLATKRVFVRTRGFASRLRCR